MRSPNRLTALTGSPPAYAQSPYRNRDQVARVKSYPRALRSPQASRRSPRNGGERPCAAPSRQEPPIAQLGPCVAGRSHLIEHLAVVRKRRLMREARHHAPGAWRVRDSYFAHGVRLTDGLITSHVKE